MITAWQKKQGLPETGFLDNFQLVALHEQAAQARRVDQAKPLRHQRKVQKALNCSAPEPWITRA
jgi:hypothetical protein